MQKYVAARLLLLFTTVWLVNLQMESSFKFKNYEFKIEKDSGTHGGVNYARIIIMDVE